MGDKHGTVKRREETYAQKITTRLWKEEPAPENPYVAEACLCHGYDLLELMQKRSLVDVFYLLFQGELPSREKAQLLEQLMIALINPGPRHPATRAGMCAGVGKTEPIQILPVSLTILGGSHLGAGEIEDAMRFLRKERKNKPAAVAKTLLDACPAPVAGDVHIAPGFGSNFGGIDRIYQRLAGQLGALPGAGKSLEWGNAFAEALHDRNMGWLATGLAAAAFTDLGFQPRFGPVLFQLLSAPGLLAHGMEMTNKPLTAMPFIKDEDYTIER